VSTVVLALRAHARYVVPFTLLSAIAFAPLVMFVIALPAASDVAQARQQLRLEWIAVGVAWFVQGLVVAAVAPAVRRLAAGERPSQLRAFGEGAANLARMALPCLVGVAAIAIGALAVVIPGLVLIALLALTGASVAEGMPAPLLDSIATVRANLRVVVIAVVAIVVADVAIAAGIYLAVFEPFAKKPTPDQLAAARRIPQLAVAVLVVASPLAASVLAAIRARAR
jgi:hypothetical protein